MIDFHSHILPGMDDGSASTEESLAMLHLSCQQGITQIVATPHYYASQEAPVHFLERRAAAWRQLADAIPKEEKRQGENMEANQEGRTKTDAQTASEIASGDIPQIYLGAEVYYYTGISHTEHLCQLCVGGTNLFLLEMPFRRWSDCMLDEILTLAQTSDLTILLAHIDRYLSFQPAKTWDTLFENGVLFQVNASSFLEGWRTRHSVLKLLKAGQIAALGSDCHNMKDRPPNLEPACAVIRSRLGKQGEEAITTINRRAEQLLLGKNGYKAL